MNKKTKKQLYALYVRNFIFGVEDSLVSTVGLLSGVATAGAGKGIIILAGVVLIFVEAFSMGAGSLLSEHSVREYLDRKKSNKKIEIKAGIIMFFSYLLTGLIPLFPYLIWAPKQALIASIVLSLVSLMILGYISAKMLKIGVIHKILEMAIIGGIAILIGVIIGSWVETLVFS